nr:hypothetical protein [Acidobacteriota bacterium]
MDQAAALVREIDAARSTGSGLFGNLWQGSSSDWDRLAGYVSYIVRYRALALNRGLAADASRAAERERPDVSQIRTLVAAGQGLREQLAVLRTLVAWPTGYFEASPISEIGTRARDLAANTRKAPAWAAFEASRQRAVATIGR